MFHAVLCPKTELGLSLGGNFRTRNVRDNSRRSLTNKEQQDLPVGKIIKYFLCWTTSGQGKYYGICFFDEVGVVAAVAEGEVGRQGTALMIDEGDAGHIFRI